MSKSAGKIGSPVCVCGAIPPLDRHVDAGERGLETSGMGRTQSNDDSVRGRQLRTECSGKVPQHLRPTGLQYLTGCREVRIFLQHSGRDWSPVTGNNVIEGDKKALGRCHINLTGSHLNTDSHFLHKQSQELRDPMRFLR